MTLLTAEIRSYVGLSSGPITMPEPVEKGAVRRHAQALMDEAPRYSEAVPGDRFGAPVAPPMFPSFMLRRSLGAPDPLTERAADTDFDGLTLDIYTGLPELPLPGLALMAAGMEVEFYRYARHGEQVVQEAVYSDIYERVSKNGPMLFVIVDTEYRTAGGEVLMRLRFNYVRR